MKHLVNKTALITGGSRGIGKATALRLARDGANIAITYGKSVQEAQKAVAEIEALGVKAKAYHADANQPETLAALVDQVLTDFATIDVLVNNAGVYENGLIQDIGYEDWERTRRVNIDAVFALANAVAKVMPEGGRIINLSSALGERATAPGISAYNASKSAVTGMSRSWAYDLAAKGILVNAVQPGPINTEMNTDDGGDGASFMKSQTALGRYGKPEEIAGVIAFLAGPEATYITGAAINVDGGWNA